MSNEQRDHHPTETSNSSRELAELKEECERLRQAVKRLEEENSVTNEALRAAIETINDYNHTALQEMAEQFPEDDWPDFKEEDYTLAAEDVIAELEAEEGR